MLEDRGDPYQSRSAHPAPVATEVRRLAKERHLTIIRTLVMLAERGSQAEQGENENLCSTYQAFMNEEEPATKEEAAKDLIRAIFGKDAIADGSFLWPASRRVAAPRTSCRSVTHPAQ